MFNSKRSYLHRILSSSPFGDVVTKDYNSDTALMAASCASMQSLSDDLLRMVLILVPQADRCQFTTIFFNPKLPKLRPGNHAMTDLYGKAWS